MHKIHVVVELTQPCKGVGWHALSLRRACFSHENHALPKASGRATLREERSGGIFLPLAFWAMQGTPAPAGMPHAPAALLFSKLTACAARQRTLIHAFGVK